MEARISVVKPDQVVFWDAYSGYFADPGGYLWEVARAMCSNVEGAAENA